MWSTTHMWIEAGIEDLTEETGYSLACYKKWIVNNLLLCVFKIRVLRCNQWKIKWDGVGRWVKLDYSLIKNGAYIVLVVALSSSIVVWLSKHDTTSLNNSMCASDPGMDFYT